MVAIVSDCTGCCTSTHRSMGLCRGGSCLCFWEAASAQGGRRGILILCTCCGGDNNSHNNSQHKVNRSNPEPNGRKPVYLCFAALLLCIHIN